jgi:hypothetical protein
MDETSRPRLYLALRSKTVPVGELVLDVFPLICLCLTTDPEVGEEVKVDGELAIAYLTLPWRVFQF